MSKAIVFAAGQRVVKASGRYHPPGVVVSVFAVDTPEGEEQRYVVRHPFGILHIYGSRDLIEDEDPKDEYVVRFS
jgi:hypothetical protein